MVRYLDPEDHPELEEEHRRCCSPGERLTRARECNAALTGTATIEATHEVTLRKLDTRACSHSELTNTIEGRGFSTKIAVEVVDRLEAVGLVGGQAYVDALVRSRLSGTGASGRTLREVLVRRELDSSTVERALSQIDRDDKAECVAQLVAHKRRSLTDVPRETAYRRLSSIFARKGYSPSVASATVRDVLNTQDEKGSSTEEAWQWGL